jgi:TonB family protein
LKREEEERQRKIEEEERKLQAEKDRQTKIANQAASKDFSKNSGSSSSEGINKWSGNQGYTTGDPNSRNYSGTGQGSKGDGFQLKGRSLQGSLPKPAYDIQEEGIVVVEITVDRTGRVVSAKYTLRGSTTQDSRLKAAAQKAALKARFNADPNASAYVKGTITYHFELD